MNPTASSLDLASKCCAWVALPKHDSGGAAASLGSAFHEIAATVINFRVPADCVEAPWHLPDVAARYNLSEDQTETLAHMVDGWRQWRAPEPGLTTRAEVAYTYDTTTDTAKELPRSPTHRDYSQAAPHEFCGTADVVSVREDSASVSDWKCGQRHYVTVPKENRQLRFLALCVARTHGVSLVKASLLFVSPEGEVFSEATTFDAFDLAAIAGEMQALAAKLATDPPPEPGPHCRWCSAVASCPATRAALVQVAPVPPPEPYRVVADAAAITGPDHATWLLHRLRAVEAAAAAVEAALKAYADAHGGIATGAGATWQRREIPQERIHLNEAALKALQDELPGVAVTTSKKAIGDAARAAKRKIAATTDTVMAMLRPLGAVTTATTVKYEDK